ncbi:MAG: hypothetical protein JNK82_36630 [Myxococcaceae bacterium]|nr:hypothetical protein [Myxococcaceae bacterium]
MTSRWLFSARVDVAVFFGAAVASAALALAGAAAGLDETPLWAWVLLVLGIDVAHVWSTLFRVYLDADELRRRPLLYFAAPAACWLLGVLAYEAGVFWRALAYVAAWHFIRQQVGFMALYGRRAGSSVWAMRFDAAAVYAVTLGPVVWWHAHLPRRFWWFVEGDFVGGLPAWCGTAALSAMFVVVAVWLLVNRHVGKALLLFATWVAWFGGIVVAKSDFTFTVMNVVLHGVAYLALTWRYARGRAADGEGYGRGAWLVRKGLPAFGAVLLGFAFAEEFLWDTFVWHERGALFGSGGVELDGALLALVVPLLALPQATHYVLDAFVWRGRENPRLAARLGWSS